MGSDGWSGQAAARNAHFQFQPEQQHATFTSRAGLGFLINFVFERRYLHPQNVTGPHESSQPCTHHTGCLGGRISPGSAGKADPDRLCSGNPVRLMNPPLSNIFKCIREKT